MRELPRLPLALKAEFEEERKGVEAGNGHDKLNNEEDEVEGEREWGEDKDEEERGAKCDVEAVDD